VLAIHGAEHVAVRRHQHPGERVQQLPRVRHVAAGAHVPLRARRCQVRQQVLAGRSLLRHRLHPLHLRRHLHLTVGSRTTVRPSHSPLLDLFPVQTSNGMAKICPDVTFAFTRYRQTSV